MRYEWLNCRDRRPRLSDTDATLYGKYRFVIRTVEDACPYNNVSIYLFVPASNSLSVRVLIYGSI